MSLLAGVWRHLGVLLVSLSRCVTRMQARTPLIQTCRGSAAQLWDGGADCERACSPSLIPATPVLSRRHPAGQARPRWLATSLWWARNM
jgi:hypothetical protein